VHESGSSPPSSVDIGCKPTMRRLSHITLFFDLVFVADFATLTSVDVA
jgi:hypothetical protein